MGYRFGEGGLGVERGTLLKLFLRDNYSDGYSSVELQITECSLYKGGVQEWEKGTIGGRNARLEECKSIFFFLSFYFHRKGFWGEFTQRKTKEFPNVQFLNTEEIMEMFKFVRRFFYFWEEIEFARLTVWRLTTHIWVVPHR